MQTTLCAIAVFLTCHLQASVIPQYEIGSINENTITFTNTAIFHVLSRDFVTFQGWQPGDEVQITSMDVGLLTSAPVQRDDGKYVVAQPFFLNNLTRSEKQITISLEQSPTTPTQGTYAINAIDLEAQAIALSNASVWNYPLNNQRNVAGWEVGDVVMIGINGLGSSPAFDAILINTTKQSVIKAVQQ